MANPGTCGLYALSQFHKPGSRLAAAAAAAAIGLVMPQVTHAALQVPTTGITQSEIAPVDTVVVRGTVVDSATQRPIMGAQVVAAGTRFGAITDHNGQFRFVMRNPVTFPFRVQAQYIGYGSHELAVTTPEAMDTIAFTMSPVMIGIVGIVVVGEAQPLVPKDNPSFWRRLWRFFWGQLIATGP